MAVKGVVAKRRRGGDQPAAGDPLAVAGPAVEGVPDFGDDDLNLVGGGGLAEAFAERRRAAAEEIQTEVRNVVNQVRVPGVWPWSR